MTRAVARPAANGRRSGRSAGAEPVSGAAPPDGLGSGDEFRRDRLVGWVMTVTGTVGGLAAFVLMVEKVQLLRDPTYVPTCSINPVLSCGSVMASDQAEAFGFPNPLLGLALFPVLATFGVLVLAGAAAPRWVWLATQGGVTFGVAFVHWLIFQSLFRIGALCPYCMVVWVVTITAFWYVTLSNMERGAVVVPAWAAGAVAALRRVHTFGLAVWFVVLAAVIVVTFWDSWVVLAG